jgi:hypothetical protein
LLSDERDEPLTVWYSTNLHKSLSQISLPD